MIKKITLPKHYKDVFTLSDLEACKKLEKSIKDNADNGKIDLSWEVCCAAIAGSDSHVCDTHVLAASAEFQKNSRIYDYYCDGSGKMDVWINVKAFDSYYGFYDIGVYLSDIWQYSSEDAEATKIHMFIKHYIEEK